MENERSPDPGTLISGLVECLNDLGEELSSDLGDKALNLIAKGRFHSILIFSVLMLVIQHYRK